MPNQKIRIVTDSVSDIPRDLLEQWEIEIIPCYVNFDGESYADDGIELDRTQFYQSISAMKDFPTTAAPPPLLAQQILEQALEGYDHIVCILVAQTLSATYNNVKIAAQNVDPERITVLDSETLSMGIGWQALIAAEVAEKTGDLDAVLQAIEQARKKHRLYAAIFSMDFLRRSGRVNGVVASIGSILQIKPIVTILERGEVDAVHRIRTFKKAQIKLRDLLIEQGEIERLAIIHTQNEEGARAFIEEYRELMPFNTIISEVGPTLGTHIGLGALGFVSVQKMN